ncbi:olfactory receptor 52B2-like [Chelonoidis abingdonii]|uniref:olfactory receptor 52B2-like n=1 Tax=Chelonoidis abingdonii TaxID=106734 RepID=UPI0013F24C3E|nr:olfactory receptor 52B2-like [Chelonoidis abingdonii]
MSVVNSTKFSHLTFILLGIPGLEDWNTWIAIPFCLMLMAALLGNCVLIFLIATKRSLQEPMYLFLSMLAVSDLVSSTSTVPKMLAIFWFRAREIAFESCLTQMFFIHFGFVAKSAILLAMVFDRYVAICDPLRYTTILTNVKVGKISIAIVIRSFCIIVPIFFLLKWLPFCRSNVLPHSYCKHIEVARLAYADITVSIWYGFAVPTVTIVLDVVFIGVSCVLILKAVIRLPTKGAWLKAFSTCGSHVCIIILFYTPAFFTLSFSHHVPHHIHILLADLYMLIPPVLNPIVYGMKTKQIRVQVGCMFSQKWKWC